MSIRERIDQLLSKERDVVFVFKEDSNKILELFVMGSEIAKGIRNVTYYPKHGIAELVFPREKLDDVLNILEYNNINEFEIVKRDTFYPTVVRVNLRASVLGYIIK